MAGPKSITGVIPAKDEAKNISDIIEACHRHCHQVLVVDGHSTDSTRTVSEGAGARVILDRKRGKGDAIRCAIDAVDTDIIVFVDADGSHDPDDIPALVAPLQRGQAEHVTGSRMLGGSSELHGGFEEFYRLAGSMFITTLINRRFDVRLSDSQNGFRAALTATLRDLDLRSDGFTIEQEMVIKTLKKGYRVAEVPTHEHARRYGESHIRILRGSPGHVLNLIRLLYF